MKTNFLFGLLLTIGVIVLNGCATQTTKYTCSDGSVVNDASECLTSDALIFGAFWRNTNPTCDHAMVKENNQKYAELSFTFSSNNKLNKECEVYVDNGATRVTFWVTEKVDEMSNAYLGAFDASQDHKVKACCGGICSKEDSVTKLCSNS